MSSNPTRDTAHDTGEPRLGPPAPVLIVGRGPHRVAAVVHALREHNVDSAGVTEDAEALTRLGAGGVAALVIGGGVTGRSRRMLERAAGAAGVDVIHGALGGCEVGAYVREELAPLLRRR